MVYCFTMMNNLNVIGLNPAVAGKITPMLEDLLREHASNIHSFHLVGSAVIPDYDEKLSDINSLVVLKAMDLRVLAFLAPLGKKYGKKRIAAPLVMTPEYIKTSLDAFPVEFLDFKLIHKTVYGSDLLRDLRIDLPHLRLQCERELKTKLIGLRQGYISSLGKKDAIAAVLVRSFTGSMALFRAIISLLGKEPPILRADVITMLGSVTGIKTDIFKELLMLKSHLLKPSEQELASLFERYYNTLESTGKIIDDLHV
jgi:predicted nucleotidyltransferase